MKTRSFAFLVCLLGTLLVAQSASGQAVLTGTLEGSVQDESNAVLPGVTLTLTDVEKGVTFTQTSGTDGTFRFLAVPVGNNYQLKAELSGFSPSVIRQIQVLTNFTQRFAIALKVGNISEEVAVLADAPLVPIDTSVSSETLKANVVNELPLYSRNKSEVTTLMPGVTFSRADSPPAWYEFHVRGDATVGHGYRVDGATSISSFLGRTGMSVAQNAIERFEFVAGGFQAEYGEQTGGMVNVITKTGTNLTHGSYDVLFRPEKLASTVRSGIPGQVNDKQPGNTQFHEVSLGGPIVRDRLWYHVAFQYWQDDRGNLLQPTVFNQDFANTRAKFTYQHTVRDRWDLSVEADPFWGTNTTLLSNFAPETQTYQDVTLYMANLQESHTFNNNTTLQSQIFVHHLGQSSGGLNARNGGTVNESNYRPFVTEVTRAGSFSTGFRENRGNWSESRLRVSEKLNVYRGAHNFKFGLDYGYLWGARWWNIFGSAYTDRRPVGGTLTRSILLQPDPTWRWGDHELAAYAQDSWKVADKVVLDLGLRWDYQTAIQEHNVAPRLGISVDPTGSGNSRAYANLGLYYQSLWVNSYGFDRISLGTQLFRIDNATGAFPNDPYQRPLIGADVLLNTFRNRIGSHYVNPHNLSWAVGYETRVPWGMKVNTTYAENHQRNWVFTLVTPTENILQSDDCGNNPLVPKCGVYRGLEVTLRKPFSNNLELMQTYTRSRVKGFGNLIGQSFTEAQARVAYAVQDWDEPNVFNTIAMYEVPYGVLVTGVFRWASGRPYSIDNAQVGTAVLYVDRQGRPSERNAERLPYMSSLDLGLQKYFVLGAGKRLKVHFQALNLTNRVNVLRVQTNFAAAGTPTQVDFSRQLQFGGGFSW